MEPIQKVDYHGTQLFSPEAEVLFVLERQLKKPVPRVSSLDWLTIHYTSDENMSKAVGFASEGGHVVELGVDNVRLAVLPESIGRLQSLKNLSLIRDRLKVLPDSIGQLSTLEKINLSLNKLTSLPESFCHLHALQTLWLEDNRLAVLPACIGQLRSLTHLLLSKNRLTTLPDSIRMLDNLKLLELGGNHIESLPEKISHWLEECRILGWC